MYTKNEITEMNKLIVGFMGLKPVEWAGSYSIGMNHCGCNEKTEEKAIHGFSGIAKYHDSWEWLMPVIKQIIETIGVKTMNECSDEEWKQSTRIVQMYIGLPIGLAHYYVVDWIKWYNKNKN